MCWDCNYNTKGDPYKTFRRGGVEPEDFEVEFDYQTRIGKKHKEKKRTRAGCPENNNGPHIYVYTTEFNDDNLFYEHFGFHIYERKHCAGCGKFGAVTRKTERYEKEKEKRYRKAYGDEFGVPRGRPISRRRHPGRKPAYGWWRWEHEDEGYLKAREAYVSLSGWTSYLHSSRWW